MGMIGTFDAFTTARLGIYAAHKGLSLTGNNIANINTKGYTRQVVDQVSFKAGANDMYRSMMDNHIGNGALITGISQIRDPYLDIRYRNTTSDVGYSEKMLKGLQEIRDILDEVGKGENKGDGLLYAQLQKLSESLRTLSANPTKDNDILARTSAEALCTLFRTYADRLETLRQNTADGFDKDISAVNKTLTNIRDLNKSIRDAELHGDKALELRDERNRQIDELSEYMHIKVEYSMEDIGGGLEVEKLTISLANDNPDPLVETDSAVLVDGVYATQLSLPENKPELNPHKGTSAKDPNYGHLNGFLYLIRDKKSPDDLTKAKGTNDPMEAVKDSPLKNDNYTIQLDKLLDSRGDEWTGVVSKPPEKVEGNRVLENAVFRVSLSAGNAQWADGDTITIGGTTFDIVDTVTDPDGQISTADANDLEKLAGIIAQNLTSADYNIKADGGNIVFTAKKKGEVGKPGEGPANQPGLEITAAEDKLVPGRTDCTNRGFKIVAPGKDTTVPNPDGTDTVTRYVESGGQWYKLEATVKHTYETVLDDNDLHGSLQATRELLTEEGEFSSSGDMLIDENATTKRGIPYYQMSLDLLAKKFAEQYNQLNMGYMVNQNGNYIDKNGKEITMKDGSKVSKTTGLTSAQKKALITAGYFLKDKDGNAVLDENKEKIADLNSWLETKNAKVPEGRGYLFSNRNDNDDPTGITASNISIAHSWSTGDVNIVPTHILLFSESGKPIANTTKNENADHMVTMIDQSLSYRPTDLDKDAVGSKLFTGSFNDMFGNMGSVLGKDQSTTEIQLNTSATTQVELDSSREGVSGVDLNDEAMNMMQFQKAYSAACRLMTAIDETLDRLINNTGVAGR